MATRLTIWAATAIALAAGAAFAEGETLETVVATINGEEVTMADVLAFKRQVGDRAQGIPDDQLFDIILNQMVQQRALAATLSEEPAWVAPTLRLQKDAILAAEAIERLSAEPVSEEEVLAAYEAEFGGSGGAPEFDASHILVDTEEEAQALIVELEAGADFAELAIEHSTGPSGPRGGALGWFGEGMMVPSFEAAVKELEVGAFTTVPVQTQFGFHVVKLNETRTTEAPALEDVRADIEGQLRSSALEAKVIELTNATELAPVEGIDTSALTTLAFE